MNTIITPQVIKGLKVESDILSLLKHIFWSEPTKDLIQSIRSVPKIQEENDIDKGLNEISEAIEENKNRLDEYLDDLAIEYARLFIGPKKPFAVPYASFYLSESKAMMSEITTDVRKQYLTAGMAVKELYKLPDDHIAIELEFLQYLATRITESYEADLRDDVSKLLQIREDYIKEHLSKWAPEFAENIINATNDKFYHGAALLLKGFVSMI